MRWNVLQLSTWSRAVFVLLVLTFSSSTFAGVLANNDSSAPTTTTAGTYTVVEIINPEVPVDNGEWCVDDLLDPKRVLLNSWTFSFSFSNSRVTTNTTDNNNTWSPSGAVVPQCGMSCRITSPTDGSIFDKVFFGTSFMLLQETLESTRTLNTTNDQLLNETIRVVANFTNVVCSIFSNPVAVVGGSTSSSSASLLSAHGFDEAVCVAFIHYNHSYWENGTVFALPRNLTAVITEDLIISGDPTNITFQFPGLTTCPWYLTARSNMGESSVEHTYATLNVSYNTGAAAQLWNVMLIHLSCATTSRSPPHGVSEATFTARLGNTAADLFFEAVYRLDYGVDSIDVVSMYPLFWFPITIPVSFAKGAGVKMLPVMDMNKSSWAAVEDYSQLPQSNATTRCYNTKPVASDGTPTTLGGVKVFCAGGRAVGWDRVANNTQE
ncbi:Hypothetical protein, putative [Bodo saltans]|uniref:Membrane-associated protein n=1 Tax=Bodo saltans TaxID=75058 RepID=A0A0S4J2N4_BODSA|nr:Hypothetical protein, putative [Bodo saltans]|eukprot:CUG85241.1 Hypothetical protein, putative [Bodo saltans]